MNIHVLCNGGQKVLFHRFFTKTLVDEWNVICHEHSSVNAIDFGTEAFTGLVYDKISILINDIIPAESKTPFFILSDIDIQFFRKCNDAIAASIKENDMVFQSERGQNKANVNIGFIAMKSNERVLSFWKQVKQELEFKRFSTTQRTVNYLLPKAKDVKWGMFSDKIWAWSNPRLSPSQPSFSGIHLHHANCTHPTKTKSSLQLKIEQLNLVSKAYQYWSG